MNEKPRKKDQNGSEACQSGERNQTKGGQGPGLSRKPHWPIGLRLPSKSDVTCFIPEALEAEGIDAIDVSGGFFV